MGLKGGKNVTGMCSIHYLYPKVHLKKNYLFTYLADLVLVAKHDLSLWHMDVVTAKLHMGS